MISAWNTLLCSLGFLSAETLHPGSLRNWEAVGSSYIRSLLWGRFGAGRWWTGSQWWLRSKTITHSRHSSYLCARMTNPELTHPLSTVLGLSDALTATRSCSHTNVYCRAFQSCSITEAPKALPISRSLGQILDILASESQRWDAICFSAVLLTTQGFFSPKSNRAH